MVKKREASAEAFSGLKEQLDSERFPAEVGALSPSSSTGREQVKEKISSVTEFTCILPGNKTPIKYAAMSTKDIKSLLLFQNAMDIALLEEVLDKLLMSVVTTPGFNIDDLYLYDKIFLLIQVRMNSKGGKIESTYTCSACKQVSYFVQNLTDLNVTEKPELTDNEIQVAEGFSVILDYVKRSKQKKMYELATAKNENERLTELGLLSMASLIKAIKINGIYVEEELTPKDRGEIFMGLPEYVFDKITEGDDKYKFGIELKYNRVCMHCSQTDTITIPLVNLF